MTRNFRYKNCAVCGSKFKPTSGVQKYCKACSYKQSKLVQAQARHRWYEAHKNNIKKVEAQEKPKNVKALYDEDIASIIKAINRNNIIWCAISIVAMIIAIIAIVL